MGEHFENDVLNHPQKASIQAFSAQSELLAFSANNATKILQLNYQKNPIIITNSALIKPSLDTNK